MKTFLPVFITVVLFILVFTVLSTKNEKQYEIVVAKYNEDISWTKNYKNVKIYDKMNGDLPNIGRESHTYLTYIVNNYYNLPDVVFFTQGCKDDHCPQISVDDFINISSMYSTNYSYLKSDYYFYSENIGYDKDHLYNYRQVKLYPNDNLGFRKWFKTYVDEEHNIDDGIYIWWGAIFSIKKECILSRPLNYYKKLLEYIPYTDNPEVGHYFERSWFYIFNCNKNI